MDPRYANDAEQYREKVRAFLAEHLPADWRGLGHMRHGSADALYGEGDGRAALERRPTEPRSLENRVVDVPEFDPQD